MTSEAKTAKPRQTMEEALYENIEAILVAIILALVLKFFALEAFKIPTGSMAPHLLGLHVEVECEHCHFKYEIGIPEDRAVKPVVELDRMVRCINCGKSFEAGRQKVRGGNRILVNKYLYGFSRPKRYDIVVFKSPDEPDKNFIKRCIAFENEELETVRGDIYIDGKIARKPRSIQDDMWIAVYDSEYRLPPAEDEMWEASGWTVEEGGFHSSGAGSLRFDSLVKDEYIYNTQTGNTNTASVVGDLLLRCEFAAPAGGTWTAAIGEDQDEFQFEMEFHGGKALCRLYRLSGARSREAQRELIGEEREIPVSVEGNELYFTNVDEAVLVKCNDEIVFEMDYEVASDAGEHTLSSVYFESRNCPVRIKHIAIDRDVHYQIDEKNIKEKILKDFYGKLRDQMRLLSERGKKFYVCFGDNVANSADSRNWGVVPAENLLGKAMLSFWPLRGEFPYLDLKAIR